ncbi:MAG: hypothetical protein JXA73_09240 [Acidobacteria bacterium]|nr:hypothetical protein [Acidobacteriota bacterium]
MIGTALGHYQIVSRLGKGGMGEVYLVKDQKPGRQAIPRQTLLAQLLSSSTGWKN